ncbi:MAG TPA: transcription antitermination factor NusB [Acidimicrobiaceae bacterium]|nr:transcription antitermination factor NusB [Acidimicrobiaceae bacterium]HCB36906.1 transcription antitermination factor NusB [Acidimicrobiaceae bacterium]
MTARAGTERADAADDGPDDRAAADPFAPAPPQRRREARERAVELLYEAEMKGCDAAEIVAAQVLEVDRRAVDLVNGVSAGIEHIDERLGRFLADGWSVERLAACDRAILRQAIFELDAAVEPVAVVLNEAVVLAHRYGATERSAAFVNGVLAAVVRAAETAE